jgi:hypothetical protein
MPNYTIKVFPKDSINLLNEPIDEIIGKISSCFKTDSSLLFNLESKKPREGFDLTSLKKTGYGIKAKYILEKKVNFTTIEGNINDFQKIEVEVKFIVEQGIFILKNSSDTLDEKLSKIWANILFPTHVVSLTDIEISKDQFHQLRTVCNSTMTEIIHTESKGLEKIQLKAIDLPNKEWYKKEDFDSANIEKCTMILTLPDSFGGKTVVCHIYRNGRFVIYHKASFADDEFEQIELFIVNKIIEILGSPLCRFGDKEKQTRLNFKFETS